MGFRDDERGQAIQIGFILIFGVLVISFASYQAFVVPNQNSGVEFNHNQQVQGQFQELRNAIVSSAGRTTTVAVALDLGTSYPARLVAANPPSPSGTLRTVGTTDSGVNLSVDNAVAQNPEAADYWNGSQRNFSTGLLEYRSNYNEYNNAPRTVYDNTLLYNQFRGANRTVTGQSLVDGNELTLVALNGSLQAARSGSYTVEVRPVSTPDGATLIEPESGENLTVSFVSRLPAEQWNETLAEEYNASPTDDRYVTGVTDEQRGDGLYEVTLTFEEDATYRLQIAKMGVGSGVTDESTTYLTELDGEGAIVQKGGSTEITLGVRDAYGNAVGNVAVNGSGGDFGETNDRSESDADGEVTFTYNATGVTAGTTQQLNFTLQDRRPEFDQSTPENVTVNLRVTSSGGGGSGDGEYTLQWDTATISGETGVKDCYSGNGTCVYDLSDDGDDTLPLTANTTPATGLVNVDFATNDTDIVTAFNPSADETDGNGIVSTDADIGTTGNVSIVASSAEDSDRLAIRVSDTSGGGGSGTSSADAVSVVSASKTTNDGSTSESIRFTLENTGGAGVNIQNITVDDAGNTDAAQVGNGTRSTGGGPPSYNDDGPELRSNRSATLLDTGSPFSFGSTEGISSTISAGDRTEYRLAEFRTSANGGGVEVDPGGTVTITLGFSDGSDETIMLNL